MVNVASYFTDPDGDALTFTAESSNSATASVSVSGSVVTVTAAARGVAIVTVRARDSGGMSAQLTFTVTVPNQAPVAVDAVPAQSIFVGDTASVDVSAYFNDPDGDALSYSVANSDATAVSASVAGSVVSLTAITQGMSTVTVTARDPDGLSAEQSVAVTVPNRAPTALDTIPSKILWTRNTLEFDVARYFTDPDGDALIFTAASAHAGVASVELVGSTLTITGRAPGSTRVTVTVADPAGMSIQQFFAVTVPNREPLAIGAIPGQSVVSGQTATIDASPFFSEPDEQTLSYAAASSNRGVATTAVAGATVTLTGVSVGTATITVTATDPGGLTAQQRFSVTVRAANQAPEVVSTVPDLTVTVGEVRAWQGADHFRDPNGDALTYAAGSSNAAVVLAVVSGGEFGIGAVSAGSAVVTVTASDPGGLSAQLSFRVMVQPETEVVISGVDPGVLVEGASTRITGSGFSATAAQNQVSVGGRSARVTSASATSLSIIVPRSDCLPPRREELRVALGSKSDARTVGVTPQSAEYYSALQAGFYVYSYAGSGCVHSPGSGTGAEYLLGVVSISEDPASLTALTLSGTPGDATVVGTASHVVASARDAKNTVTKAPFDVLVSGGPVARSLGSRDQGFENTAVANDSLRISRARAHNQMMVRNEELLRRLGRAGQTPVAPARAGARAAVEVGDTLTLYADFHGTPCSESGQVQAVVRLVGNSAVWMDDVENPVRTFSDAELADLDTFYAARVKGIHDDYFGALSDVDDNGRLLVLMTKEVNRVENLNGWVQFADLYPNSQCSTSNQAEIFYGQVPDPSGSFGEAVTKQDVLDKYPALIAHEVTHLIQANAWRFGQARYASWELEGGATLAEQLVAYDLFGHGSGRNMGFEEYRAGSTWYGSWLGDMFSFFGWDPQEGSGARIRHAPEQCSWVGRRKEGNTGPCVGRTVYGMPSMVFRYAMDRWGQEYPGGEQALMTRLTQSPRYGFASLEAIRADWRIERFLAEFYMALWMDGRWGNWMASWDLYDIFSNFRAERQLQPYRSRSTQPRITASVRAGSSLYLHWTIARSLNPTAIKVTSASGGPVPDHISVWALRIR